MAAISGYRRGGPLDPGGGALPKMSGIDRPRGFNRGGALDSYGSPPSVSSKGSSTPASDRRLPSQRVGVDPGADRGPSYGQRSPSGAGGSSLANLEHRAGGGAGHSRHAPAGTTLPAPVRSSVGERGKMETFIHPVSVWSFLSRVSMKSHRDDIVVATQLCCSLFSPSTAAPICVTRLAPDPIARSVHRPA